ncbi:MAG: DUF72 domain-containing protein [Actinobacteria bacterium]|nr:DUF72 domain-containing protein [Actinomycetota bacterium]
MTCVGTVRVGISGWRYPPWRGSFYPPGLPQRRELEHASQQLSSIELNGSFYALQRPESYAEWAHETPDGFVFSVKGPRFVTHLKKLAGVDVALANFFASGLLALGPKLGPVLWQLPPNLGFDAARLEAFLDLLPQTHGEAAALGAGHDEKVEGRALTTTATPDLPLRHALEVRHASFGAAAADGRLLDVLTRRGVALVTADTAGKWPWLAHLTSPDLAYARLHGDAELYVSGYDDAALDRWADRVREWAATGRDVFVYFDNDVKVRAPYDARALAARLGVAWPRREVG